MRKRQPSSLVNAPEPPPMQPAGMWRRAAARAIDTLCMLMLCALAWLAMGTVAAILAMSGLLDPFGTDEAGVGVMLIVAMVGLALMLPYCYEVVSTARTGQTVGKKTMGVVVIRVGSHRSRFWARWALPHLVGLVAAYAGASVGLWAFGTIGLLVGIGSGLLGWMPVYTSALWDKDRRGWHDKVAGTIVVRATEEVLERLVAPESEAREPVSRDRPAIRDDPPRQSYVQYWDELWSVDEAKRNRPPPRLEADEQPDQAPRGQLTRELGSTVAGAAMPHERSTEMPESPRPADKPRRGVNGGEAVLGDGQKVELADLQARLAGRLLDPVLLVLFVLGALTIGGVASFMESFGGLDDFAHNAVLKTSLVVSTLVFSVVVFYETAAVGLSGQTWGKRRRQVRVVTCRDGAVPSESRALVRALVPAAAGAGGVAAAALADFRDPAQGGLALWLVVYASALWGRGGRGWHDMAAGTVVVTASSTTQQRTPTRHHRPQPASSVSVRPDSESVHDSAPSWGMVSDYYGPRRSQGTEEHTSGTGS